MEIHKDENVKRKPRTKKVRIFNNGGEFKDLKLKTLNSYHFLLLTTQ